MLLYDRMIEQLTWAVGQELKSPDPRSQRNARNCAETLRLLRRAGVYEASNLAGLFMSSGREFKGGIPQKPPNGVTWVEWRSLDGGSDDTMGTMIAGFAREDAERVFRDLGLPADGGERNDFIRGADEYYVSNSFVFHHGGRQGQAPLNEISQPGVNCLWALGDSCRRVEGLIFFTHPSYRFNQNVLIFDPSLGAEGVGYDGFPWPAWFLFALLHCRNVSAETVEPDAAVQRKAAKAGKPPRAVYKTLKLHLPATRRARKAGGSSGVTMPFHGCRGHFKNLTHPRYKGHDNPGGNWHYWSEHFRGDPEAGTVIKDYEAVGR